MNPRAPLAAEPCPLVAGHFRRFATSRYSVRIATPGETNTKRRRNPAEPPNRALERIVAAPSMSPARSAPMANTSRTSSPEKPQRSMPQRHRTDSAMSTGIHPAWCTNSSLGHESRDLRMAWRDSITYGILVHQDLLTLCYC